VGKLEGLVMKPYGLLIIEWPDKGDLAYMGAPTRCGKRGARAKSLARRYWARKARRANKNISID
jgi:hypothetical protein